MASSSPASPDAERADADRNYVVVSRAAYHRYVRPAAARATDVYQKYAHPTAKRMVATAYDKYVRPAAARMATAAYQRYVVAPATTGPTDAERAAAAAAEAYQKYVVAARPDTTPTESTHTTATMLAGNSGDANSPGKWSPAVG